MSDEKLLLKLDDFQKNICLNIGTLRDDYHFSDVTLVCEDGQVEAHRIVLGASSATFMKILKTNKHQHPLIYFRGLKSRYLDPILDFIYNGQVSVPEDDLNDFLATAEELQIQGLVEDIVDYVTEDTIESPTTKVKNDRQKRIENIDEKGITEEPNNVAPKLELPFEKAFNNDNEKEERETTLLNPNMNKYIQQEHIFKELDKIVLSKTSKLDGILVCAECNYKTKHKTNIRNHIESKHMIYINNVKIPCLHCEEFIWTRSALWAHVKRRHPETK